MCAWEWKKYQEGVYAYTYTWTPNEINMETDINLWRDPNGLMATNAPMQQRIKKFIQNNQETLSIVLTHCACYALAAITIRALNVSGNNINIPKPNSNTTNTIWHPILTALYGYIFKTGRDLLLVLRTHRQKERRAAFCIQRHYRKHALRALIEQPAPTSTSTEHTQHATEPANPKTWHTQPAAGAA